MRERAINFGSHDGLVGVVTLPEQRSAHRPAVLFSNVGLNHHVGCSRLWVELGRRLGQLGFPSLRFDFSGFGDSAHRPGSFDDVERAILDTREAADCLVSRFGAGGIVIVAHCSGVDSQHGTALRDERVVGMVSIDGYTYPNRGFLWRHHATRFFQIARWRRRLRQRRLARLGDVTQVAGPGNGVWTRDWPSRERFAADLATLTHRGVRMLMVYTSAVRINYQRQFHDTFGFHHQIEVARFPRADHLFSARGDRAALIDTVADWMDEAWRDRPTQPHGS